jgi:ribosomal-protein-alanine N-acetyltransferase
MEDSAALHSIVSQPGVMRFLPEDVMSREEVDEILAWLIESYDVNTPEQIRKFSVAVLTDAGRLVGWCGLGPLEYDESQIELYYGISQPDWGHGYATEAAEAILHYGLDVIRLPEIVAVVSPANPASIRVAEKLQMNRVGVVRGLGPEHRHYEGLIQFSSGSPTRA